jgi:hypothetical protein
MDAPHYFTVDEANALVPALESAFGRIMRLRVELRATGAALERMGERTDAEALAREDGSREALAVRGRARALLEALSEELHELGELGVQVKDLDTGLCDFVASRDGRDVLLCWRFGEKQIGYWHELEAGFAGRQPIDGAFERVLH